MVIHKDQWVRFSNTPRYWNAEMIRGTAETNRMSFDREDDHDYLITSGSMDASSRVPSMLELALEYFQKEDPESTAMGYLQSGVGREPWAVVMAADPDALLRLVMELIQHHCPEVSVSIIDADEDIDDEFDISDLLEED